MLFDFSELPPGEGYKLMVSTIVPRPIAWVVTQSPAGVVNAAPFSFFNALSGNPPILGVSIGDSPRGPGDKDTLANIKATGQFVVCLVSEATAHAMNVSVVIGLIPPIRSSCESRWPNTGVRELNTQYTAAANTHWAAIANNYGAISGSGGDALFVDCLHFNDNGYDVIAQQFYSAIVNNGLLR